MKRRKVMLVVGSVFLLVIILVVFSLARPHTAPGIKYTEMPGPSLATFIKVQSTSPASLTLPHQVVGTTPTPTPAPAPTAPPSNQNSNQPQAPTSSMSANDHYFPAGTSVGTMMAEAANLTKQQVKTLIEQQINANWGVIQTKLGFTSQAKGYAFFLGLASRESTLNAALETGNGAGHSYGPIQAAEPAYANADPNYTPEPDVPQMFQYDFTPENFYDPGIAVHMGIRHLLHFADQAQAAGYRGSDMLRHALIGYNTGDINGADASLMQQYADEIGALAGWYLSNNHLYDGEFAYTGDPQVNRSNYWGWY